MIQCVDKINVGYGFTDDRGPNLLDLTHFFSDIDVCGVIDTQKASGAHKWVAP